MTNKDQKINMLIIIPLLITFTLTITITYAFFKKTIKTDSLISIKTGTKYIGIYGENKNNIELGKSYTFTIENRGLEAASYKLTIEDIVNEIGRENISYSYLKEGELQTGKLSDEIIENENLEAGQSITITITLNSDTSKKYQGKIKVSTEEIMLGYCRNIKTTPNPPELVGDMIPVIYDEESNNWKKAKTESGEWYDYNNRKWANAITINESTKREEYKNASIGTIIDINDINTFFVWIPRYSYTLGNKYGCKTSGASDPALLTPGGFDIKFVSRDITDTGSGQYTGNNPENYYTPSSFCFGDTCDEEEKRNQSGNVELSGIWISKFEITGTIDNISSVPNTPSIRQNISTLFNSIKNEMNKENAATKYGFNGNYDTHLIKNTEWGAMAYLSQSIYGKYGNRNYKGPDKEIFQNKSTNFITGMSNTTPSQGTYNTQVEYNISIKGTGASTTGTIYGIYDTSGGAVEFVMANSDNVLSSSGFSSMPDKKYYNLYQNASNTSGIKGDAMGLDGTAGFYGDHIAYINNDAPWATHGGVHTDGTNGGIFHFSNNFGINDGITSTRIAIVNAK